MERLRTHRCDQPLSDAIVRDDTAMAAGGQANVLAFPLIHRAHADTPAPGPGRHPRQNRPR
ncbi:hypothetical protein F3K40_34345 [Streptomyces sp. LBUM 1478]|nr:hypothetical protein [Streptomyces sp. LBUM 1484]MBP5871529.1 hypothetical protein [Streptomyces sp. LBUM 1485]MBP5879975.1 hypothetical protein [Streptomyces sp. LBUM 1477]MBP5887805.1 hypothetical protein [Streptomyces sp. LBUM 1487]MBP5889614.1 hypothetical protein [Streptomyces sp. LBUM 1481]MBP5903809.1 hypothetical protein [Streptomyces sp. LBUM 1488]MBP5909639.1 hypothetical protein [Streptomyces sp. LBUM 1478]MBP5912488.1 hypothetical protein [Streptomyces sp. LBUM 1486]MBP591963